MRVIGHSRTTGADVFLLREKHYNCEVCLPYDHRRGFSISIVYGGYTFTVRFDMFGIPQGYFNCKTYTYAHSKMSPYNDRLRRLYPKIQYTKTIFTIAPHIGRGALNGYSVYPDPLHCVSQFAIGAPLRPDAQLCGRREYGCVKSIFHSLPDAIRTELLDNLGFDIYVLV